MDWDMAAGCISSRFRDASGQSGEHVRETRNSEGGGLKFLWSYTMGRGSLPGAACWIGRGFVPANALCSATPVGLPPGSLRLKCFRGSSSSHSQARNSDPAVDAATTATITTQTTTATYDAPSMSPSSSPLNTSANPSTTSTSTAEATTMSLTSAPSSSSHPPSSAIAGREDRDYTSTNTTAAQTLSWWQYMGWTSSSSGAAASENGVARTGGSGEGDSEAGVKAIADTN
ncbi:hypothetical protein CVT26_004361 [Gymnopilus dilepis]|uniref:Uncharacterized protein n=1 Tax=Gymnopilus dilepis TaxID=231916 RepID=A0A409W6S2_9AGAR|nr:hypothetical protein CVT26_004361 [Gymnopilus dilepis]